jgi:ABC-type spermidine/putrescine transport system permease subunit I
MEVSIVKRYLKELTFFTFAVAFAGLAVYFRHRYSLLAPYYPSSSEHFWVAASPEESLHQYFKESLVLAEIFIAIALVLLYKKRNR